MSNDINDISNLNAVLEAAIVTEVTGAYANRGQPYWREPSMSVTRLTDYVMQHGECSRLFYYHYLNRTQVTGRVRHICQRLWRAEKFAVSYGVGQSRKEVRCYEPMIK
jgi:hypothetical protein